MRRLVFLVLLAVLGGGALINAQGAPGPDEWYLGKPIADFRFEGLQRIRSSELNGIVQPFIGQPWTEERVADIKRRLYALEYFDFIDFSSNPFQGQKSSVELVFSVTERPTFSQVIVVGNVGMRASDVLQSAKIKPGDTVNRSKIPADEDAIRKLYIEKGYSKIQVSSEIRDVPGRPNVRDLVFTVVEGNQSTIRTIRFSGNNFTSDASLKALLKSKEQALFSTGEFVEVNIQNDVETIRNYYFENGYPDVKVDSSFSSEPDAKELKDYITISFAIEEGQQWKFGGFTLTGNVIFTTPELLKATVSKAGAIINQTKVNADQRAIQEVYYQQGYVFNEFTPTVRRDPETKSIYYSIAISEHGIAYVGEIVVRGNTKTKREIIEREIPLHVGDVFSSEKLRLAYYNLVNLKYFSEVTPGVDINQQTGLIQLTFTVVEQTTIDLKVGGSLSGDVSFPISFIAKWADTNFLGFGQNFGLDLSVGGDTQSGKVSFQDAWLFGESFGGGASIGVTHSKVQSVYRAWEEQGYGATTPVVGDPGIVYKAYESWNVGLNLSLAKTFRTRIGRLTLGGGIGTEFNYLKYDPNQWQPIDKTIRDNYDTFLPINQLNLGVSFDARDISYDPSRGFYAAQNITFYGGPLLGSRNYIATSTTFQVWFTLWDLPVFEGWNWKLSLGINSSLDVLWAWPSDGWIFTKGGTNFNVGDRLLTINPMIVARGWYNWQTAASSGGKALWNNWAELRTPIIKNALSFDLYFDAVRLIPEAADTFNFHADGWLFGFGGGFRLAMQGLPLRLYLGKRFKINGSGAIEWQRGTIFNSSSESATDGVDLILAISLL